LAEIGLKQQQHGVAAMALEGRFERNRSSFCQMDSTASGTFPTAGLFKPEAQAKDCALCPSLAIQAQFAVFSGKNSLKSVEHRHFRLPTSS
jgi:hypothetical protein